MVVFNYFIVAHNMSIYFFVRLVSVLTGVFVNAISEVLSAAFTFKQVPATS